LLDALDEQGLTQAELAERTGFSRKHVNDLVQGRAIISAETAMKLEAVVGGSARFWMVREAQYREALTRRAHLDALRAESGWLGLLPIADMVKFGWIRRFSHRGAQVAECLRFFGVASVDAWRSIWEEPLAAFRASVKAEKKFGAIAAWLREGQRAASSLRCEPFNEKAFRGLLPQLRRLTLEPDPEVFVPQLQEACAKVGVAVVLRPTPKGCPAHGATRWLTSNRAMLLLSLRYKTNDQLWFSFFHECGHLLKHGKRMLFLEGTSGINPEHEEAADRFAADLLIPPSDALRLRLIGFARAAVRRFADEVGVAPGIVVGRMQWEKILPHTHLNGLKVTYQWIKKEPIS